MQVLFERRGSCADAGPPSGMGALGLCGGGV
jgi:hypothetical protein